ncbi:MULTISPECIES: M15 family metallopeptidase [unclassified Sphingomonas]|uniref:M15 family metallopeptidase n=1 Tax=unclassified Sphingomonas TaxID=196159 RepID=UPI001F5AEA25|nr:MULTISPECIES: M15 family metallopeptidase [unclassified Sphingomonas]
MMRRILPLLAFVAAASPAMAQVCSGGLGGVGEGRLMGHLFYGDAPQDDLVPAPAGYALGRECLLRRDAMPDLIRLIDASRADPRTGGRILALSCHRSVARQSAVFGRERPDGGASDRAESVAPPGYSEHGTGYALDFAIRPANGCPDAEACMAATPAARWLRTNAPRYGFEQSFPGGNRQQVKWEPWHWRWVGVNGDVAAAARARALFACARKRFPADPGIVPLVVRVAVQPAMPVHGAPPRPVVRKRR